MNRLNAGQEIRVVSDQWRTPTYVGDVSAGVQHLVENAANGIFHICGEECLTIAEIAFQVADYMKLDRSLHPATTEEMQEARPPFQWDEYSKSPDYTWLPATKAILMEETLTDKLIRLFAQIKVCALHNIEI